MLGKDHFYNESIRNLVVAFGMMFKGIKVSRKKKDGSTELVQVPVFFSDKTKMYRMVFEGAGSRNIALPRISFNFSVEGVDDVRKTSRGHQTKLSGDSQNAIWSYAPVPYNFNFELTIWCNDIEESLQIVEQILPNFQPSLTVKIKPLEAHPDVIMDIPVILKSVSNDFENSGDTDVRDYYSWNMDFTVKGWLFNSIVQTDGEIILDVSGVTLYEMMNGIENGSV